MNASQQIRLTALELAVQSSHGSDREERILKKASHFEMYVLNGYKPSEPSNLVSHAHSELELIGEEPEIIEGYLKVIQAFADMGHSGGSASVAIPVINELLQFKNLKPLTEDPFDWIEVGENMWQNRRNSEAFSQDCGQTYYLLSEGGTQENPSPLHESERMVYYNHG